MKNYLLFILILCSSTTVSAQCQFGHRYSDPYLNIKKQNSPGDSSVVFINANGSGSIFSLKKIDCNSNYYYKEEVGYLNRVKIKFDSVGRVNMFYYKYNSGFWGSAGHGTEFVTYFGNGNIKTAGWIEGKYGKIRFYDTLDHAECEAKRLTKLKEVECVKFRSKWYILLRKYPGLESYGFSKRRNLIRTNEKNIRRIEINWKDGFIISDDVIKDIISLY